MIPALCQRGAIFVLLLGCLLMAFPASGSQPLPMVGMNEVDGHLTMTTCLPPGRLDCNATDADGTQLSGFVFVQGDGQHNKVRIFRLKGTAPEVIGGQTQSTAAQLGHSFLVALQANANPDHFVLHFISTRSEDGQSIADEVHLGRNCCGYYLFGKRAGQPLPVGRAEHFDQLMLTSAETYAHFEQVASRCQRPGFQFVPASRNSPSVLREVVSSDEARPDRQTIARFDHLLSELDNNQFARRESASAELVAAGRSTLWYLDHLYEQPFSAEQQQRIRSVRSKLSDLSTPNLPFAFAAEEIRQLEDRPSVEWLSQLQHSSEPRFAAWARRKLSIAGPHALDTPHDHSHSPGQLDVPPCSPHDTVPGDDPE